MRERPWKSRIGERERERESNEFITRNMFSRTYSPIVLLGSQVPSIVKVLHKQLKDKSMKTRQGCFSLLTALVTVLPGALDDHVGAIIPGILYCLKYVS